MRRILDIQNGGLVLVEGNSVIKVDSFRDIINAVATGDLFCSSSIDFPEEYTTDAKVLEICHGLQTNFDNRGM
jgi:hypothetical protein